ncbi:hypothetical protein ACQJBY_069380 [Aegilops geniculata]
MNLFPICELSLYSRTFRKIMNFFKSMKLFKLLERVRMYIFSTKTNFFKKQKNFCMITYHDYLHEECFRQYNNENKHFWPLKHILLLGHLIGPFYVENEKC